MARGRKQGAAQAPAGPGTSACPLCGEVVPVGEDGRCDLGHRVRQPGAASQPTEPLSHVDVIEPGVGVPVEGIAGTAAAGLAIADTVPLEDAELSETVDLGMDDEATDDEAVDIAPLDPADVDAERDLDAKAGDADAPDPDFSGELDW